MLDEMVIILLCMVSQNRHNKKLLPWQPYWNVLVMIWLGIEYKSIPSTTGMVASQNKFVLECNHNNMFKLAAMDFSIFTNQGFWSRTHTFSLFLAYLTANLKFPGSTI